MLEEKQYDEKWFLSLIIYVLGLILFFEWIRPLHAIVNFEYLYLFILFALFTFSLTILRLPSWLSIILKTTGLLTIIHFIFLPGQAFSDEWRHAVQLEFEINSAALFQRNWYLFTELFQTFIFLVVIALVSYILYFWLVTMNRVFIFISLTIIFVTIMDTFTLFMANQAIVRIVLMSILTLVLNHYLKRHTEKQIPFDFSSFFLRLLTPLIFAMLGLSLFSYFAPKSAPVWPDPVPFITHVGTNTGESIGGGQARQVGYGEDDRRLGGSFHMDDTPVFYAETSLDHYWRIESKDFYTGQGWIREQPLEYKPYSSGSLDMTISMVVDDDREASVEYAEGTTLSRLVYPYGLINVDHERVDAFVYDESTGRIEPEIHETADGVLDFQMFPLAPFELTYQYPNISYDHLRQAPEAIPHEIGSSYLQLPDELPERVIQLAEDIVAEEETIYDQVVAIERYFSLGDFTYQIDDVPFPEEDQDYVDQFLFETQAGYCDNFSTSMVVMLRAVGIPARWAKGFTSGQAIEDLSTDEEDTFRYEVTNSNAHSWVEVYFPDIGWMPFEPTIGFSGSDMLFSEDRPWDDVEIDGEEQPSTEDEHEAIEEEQETDLDMSEAESEQSTFASLTFWLWIIAIFIVLVSVTLVIMKWKAIVQKLIFWYWPAFKNDREFTQAYQMIFRLLSIRDMKREPNQTLHDFADQVDQHLNTTRMTELTDQYTQLIYRKDYTVANKSLQHTRFQELIKQILT